jgi:phosphate uptake regulator
MEKHVFKFGTGSLAVVIPKRWAEQNGVDTNMVVNIRENEYGELLFSTRSEGRREVEREISRTMKGTLISRWLGMHYLYGFGKIRLFSKGGFTQDQLNMAEKRILDCPGLEITNESSDEIVIEDFTDIKDVDLDKVVERLRSLISQEFTEILKGNYKPVAKIEKLVNRFYMLGIRYVNITQAKDALKYLECLQQLEYISDRLEIVSSSLKSRGLEILKELAAQFNISLDGFYGDLNAIMKVAEIRSGLKAKILRFNGDRLEKYLLSQLSNSISSIAEFGLREEDRDKA